MIELHFKVHIAPNYYVQAYIQITLKDQIVVWIDDCQIAFKIIKQYLQEPPILMPPVPGRPLIMYLTVLEGSMGCVLGQ